MEQNKKKDSWFESATVGDTFDKVVDSLDALGLRVILDNHVSRASWCCNLDNGHGWWTLRPVT
jgi:endoglucanase